MTHRSWKDTPRLSLLAWAAASALLGSAQAQTVPVKAIPQWGDLIAQAPSQPAPAAPAAPAAQADKGTTGAPVNENVAKFRKLIEPLQAQLAVTAEAWKAFKLPGPMDLAQGTWSLMLDAALPSRAVKQSVERARGNPASALDSADASRSPAARIARIGELPTLLAVTSALPLGADGKPATGRALSLAQAIELAVNRSLDVQAFAQRRESFAQTALAARGSLLPHVDLRGAKGRGQLESNDPKLLSYRKEATLSVKQTLFDIAARTEYQHQGVLAAAADLNWQAAISNASLEVSSAYLQALQSRLTIELSRDYEVLLGELLTYITERANAGGTSTAERDRVRARVANARSQMADARANLRASLRNLQSLIGEEPAGLAVDLPVNLGIPTAADEARTEAHASNRDLIAARTEAEAARLETNGQYARHLPKFDLEITHSRALNASGAPSYSQDTKAMLVANWSLYNGGTDQAQARAASARMQEKQLRADDTQRKLDQEVEAAYAALDAVNERYAALREELQANRTVVEAFKAQLVGGNRPLLDVLDAYQRLHQSKTDIAQLVISEVQNHVKVAHLTGRLAQPLAVAATQP
jgi:adhesin transport system outer membrane protein